MVNDRDDITRGEEEAGGGYSRSSTEEDIIATPRETSGDGAYPAVRSDGMATVYRCTPSTNASSNRVA